MFEDGGRLVTGGGEEVEGGHCRLLAELLWNVIVSEVIGESILVEQHFARESPIVVQCPQHWIIRTSHQG